MRQHMMNLALKLVGVPYIWGGSSPWAGFDCSGFVVWLYQVFGILPSGDWTAQGLLEKCRDIISADKRGVLPGDLIFYGQGQHKVTHVMLALGDTLCVGASGGDSTTGTIEAAHRRGARVKVKPIDYRRDRIAIVLVRFPGE